MHNGNGCIGRLIKLADLVLNRKFARNRHPMIERVLKTKLLEMAAKYPIVTVTGPRQSGKIVSY